MGKTVHALWQGRALCGFSDRVPMYWPDEDVWTDARDTKNITCSSCRKEAQKLVKQLARQKRGRAR